MLIDKGSSRRTLNVGLGSRLRYSYNRSGDGGKPQVTVITYYKYCKGQVAF